MQSLRTRVRSLALLLAGVMAFTGCSSGAKKGAAIGGAIGAATGAVVGHQSKRTGAGAATGAVVGAAAGAIIGDYMEKQKRALEKVPGAEVDKEGDRLRVTFREPILFDFDSAVLKSSAQDILTQMAQVLKDYPDTDVVIHGYTDSVGPSLYNLKLSERRAAAVRDYLASHSVDHARMRAIGHGETNFVASNATASGRATNRRVEVTITPNEELRARAQEEAANR